MLDLREDGAAPFCAFALDEIESHPFKRTGGCHCGLISYEAKVDPATARVCHCTDCQS